MEQNELYEAIFRRKSVRKYNPNPLDEGTLAGINSFMTSLIPMDPGIQTELKIMGSGDVRGMFKVDTPYYLAIFSEAKDGYLANAGFMLQQLDLFFSKGGIGSCWQGIIKPVGKARGNSELEFVISLAFGLPAADVHRNSVSEFKRKPLSEITDIKGLDDILESARLAPSASNNQPWFFTGGNDMINSYAAKSAILGRMNLVSVGIALCHLWLAAVHFGRKVEFVSDESGQANPLKGYSYVASMATSNK